MSIDLTTCIGCNACVVACQAENNIPVVGKEQVAAGREMHWLRIDRYNAGPADAPTEFHFQPVPCMHCENAPCEYVCPVEATVHSADGLNDMVYNRCVGTRYCSNNCPYKVRRFNFFHYADYATRERAPAVQPRRDRALARRHGEVHATACSASATPRSTPRREGRPIADGEVLTACQAACPAEAIVFGDLNDPKSEVKQWKDSPLNYALLADLNTQPRTTYLAALRNPNPDAGGGVTWRPTPRRTPAAAEAGDEPSYLAPGHSFRSVTDKISAIVLTPADAPRLATPASPSARAAGAAVRRRRHLPARRAASASGASTSRWPGASPSPTSSGGSASATPAR